MRLGALEEGEEVGEQVVGLHRLFLIHHVEGTGKGVGTREHVVGRRLDAGDLDGADGIVQRAERDVADRLRVARDVFHQRAGGVGGVRRIDEGRRVLDADEFEEGAARARAVFALCDGDLARRGRALDAAPIGDRTGVDIFELRDGQVIQSVVVVYDDRDAVLADGVHFDAFRIFALDLAGSHAQFDRAVLRLGNTHAGAAARDVDRVLRHAAIVTRRDTECQSAGHSQGTDAHEDLFHFLLSPSKFVPPLYRAHV